MFSDPPYGIGIVSETTSKVGGSKPFGKVGTIHKGMKAKPIIESNIYPQIIGDDDGHTARTSFSLLWEKYPKAIHIWWGANHYSEVFPKSSCWIVWDKDNGDSFFADAELAFCSSKTAVRIFKHTWNGLIKESEQSSKRVHPTQKPIALAIWASKEYDSDEAIIFDPFLGSGSTLMACENLGRKCRGIELSPEYIAVTLQRWHEATGKHPDLIK